MILEGPEKRVQKVKLSNTGSTLGTSFRDTFADIFGLVFKKVDLQILLRFRPLRARLQDSSESDVLWRRSLWDLVDEVVMANTTLLFRFALPALQGQSSYFCLCRNL